MEVIAHLEIVGKNIAFAQKSHSDMDGMSKVADAFGRTASTRNGHTNVDFGDSFNLNLGKTMKETTATVRTATELAGELGAAFVVARTAYGNAFGGPR